MKVAIESVWAIHPAIHTCAQTSELYIAHGVDLLGELEVPAPEGKGLKWRQFPRTHQMSGNLEIMCWWPVDGGLVECRNSYGDDKEFLGVCTHIYCGGGGDVESPFVRPVIEPTN